MSINDVYVKLYVDVELVLYMNYDGDVCLCMGLCVCV